MALTDEDGDVDTTWDYDVFGAVRNLTGSQPNDFTFAGEQVDGSTGLQYLRARYYDPEVGRFISKDQWPPSSRNPQSLNLYAYVQNNPPKYVDPLGLGPREEDTFAIGKGAVTSATLVTAGVAAGIVAVAYLPPREQYRLLWPELIEFVEQYLAEERTVEGGYEGGNWLPVNNEVARRLGVSRQELREAVHRAKGAVRPPVPPDEEVEIDPTNGDIRIKDRPEEGVIGNVYEDRGKR
ncbi:MAG TPA: RHS repeat-associated core domain-containing protein [Dehalococcoidia bacterium]|nr:RHS repeat-associated core domain-containing protein [Dehalococcoidia bacterium]